MAWKFLPPARQGEASKSFCKLLSCLLPALDRASPCATCAWRRSRPAGCRATTSGTAWATWPAACAPPASWATWRATGGTSTTRRRRAACRPCWAGACATSAPRRSPRGRTRCVEGGQVPAGIDGTLPVLSKPRYNAGMSLQTHGGRTLLFV